MNLWHKKRCSLDSLLSGWHCMQRETTGSPAFLSWAQMARVWEMHVCQLAGCLTHSAFSGETAGHTHFLRVNGAVPSPHLRTKFLFSIYANISSGISISGVVTGTQPAYRGTENDNVWKIAHSIQMCISNTVTLHISLKCELPRNTAWICVESPRGSLRETLSFPCHVP